MSTNMQGDIPVREVAEEMISSQMAIVLVLVAFTALLLGYLFVLAPKLEGEKNFAYDYELPKERFEFFHTVNNPPPEESSQLEKMMYKRILAAALLKWAVKGLETYERISKDHTDYQRLYKSGLCDEFLWNSVVAAKEDLDQEMNDIVAATDYVNPQAKGSIFKEAAQIMQRLRQIRKADEEAAAKAKAEEEADEETGETAEERSERAAAELIKEEEAKEKKKKSKH